MPNFSYRPAPIAPTPLIGRANDVAALVHELVQAATRLLTLTGPGGVGKTHLALAVAAELTSHFRSGTPFVDLAPIRNPELVLPVIAQTLDIQEEPNRRLLDTLVDVLRPRHILLILDNMEQVVAAAPTLANLLTDCPRLSILVTSRVPLRLRAEQAFVVAPLALPTLEQRGGTDDAVARLAAAPAVTLFVRRAQATMPDFELTPNNVLAVVEICQRLDGLPLAIELAAGWSRLLSPEALLQQLRRSLAVLAGGPRDLPERQQTMRAAIEWSYDLLPPELQLLFRHLAVFDGGFTLESAEAIREMPAGSAPQMDVLHGIRNLIDQSVIRPVAPEHAMRFGMLETIREFGLERLSAEGNIETLRRRHATYFVELAERAEPALQGTLDQAAWLDRLAADQGNLRGALTWSSEHDPPTAVRLGAALEPYWRLRGQLSEGWAWLEQILPMARRPALAAVPRAKALLAAATMSMTRGQLDATAALADESLAIWVRTTDRSGLARCLNVLGGCAVLQGNLSLAGRRLEEALALRRELGDERGAGAVLQNLGVLAATQGDGRRAQSFLDEALSLARTRGDRMGEAGILRQLARLAQDQGEYEHATRVCSQALTIDRALGDDADAAWSLIRLGSVALDEGDEARAEPLLVEALDMARAVGDEPAVGEALVLLGRAAARLGEGERAAPLLEEALGIGRGLDDAVIVGGASRALGDLARTRGDGGEAVARLREALSRHEAGDDVPGVVGPLTSAGLLLGRARSMAPAARMLGAAEALREPIGVVLAPAERPELERAIGEARGTLGKAALAKAWAAGRSLSPGEAVAEAVAALEEVPVALPRLPVAGEAAERPAGLSEREVEVLRLVAGGLTNAEIAERLFLSPHTVNAHLRRVYGKLGVASRSAATRFALEHGIA